MYTAPFPVTLDLGSICHYVIFVTLGKHNHNPKVEAICDKFAQIAGLSGANIAYPARFIQLVST